MIDITALIAEEVRKSGIKDGFCRLFVPHTTAAITINENADPDVVADILYALDKAVPWTSPYYRHGEGNTAAHVKASMMGSSAQIPVKNERLQLGTWQAIYFCEFDGPRSRTLWIVLK